MTQLRSVSRNLENSKRLEVSLSRRTVVICRTARQSPSAPLISRCWWLRRVELKTRCGPSFSGRLERRIPSESVVERGKDQRWSIDGVRATARIGDDDRTFRKKVRHLLG